MEPASLLAQTKVLAGLDAGAIEELAGHSETIELSSGEQLYAVGDRAEHFYVVAGGRLRVSSSAGATVGYVGRLEPVGEMGVLAGEPRSANVVAVRDSVLLRIPQAELRAFLHDNPAALLVLSQLVIGRLRSQGRSRMTSATELRGTIALIPATPDVPVAVLAEALVHRLGGWPKARLITAGHVDAALGEGTAQSGPDEGERRERLRAWLGELEGRHEYVICAAEAHDDNWTLRCAHNADRVLVLAEATVRPAPIPSLGELRRGGAPVELVLLRPEGDPSPYTLAWREMTAARAHYFLHPWAERELAALARQLTASGVCLVLGGGGARGFAHIGLIRALERLGLPIDALGGTSMGAFIAALVACGFDSVEIAEIVRESFVRSNYLNDFALPRVSLIRGRKFGGRLGAIFGERQIEDLRRTFFCVSTSLTSGGAVVHDRGPLAVWVGSSMALPGVAPPIAFEEELLCDGGVVDNLPTDVMQGLERGSIIACSVSTEGVIGLSGAGLGTPDPEAALRSRRRDGGPRLGEILMRSATLGGDAAMARAAEHADLYLKMPTEGVGLFDWKRLDEMIERGYEHALAELTPRREELAAAA